MESNFYDALTIVGRGHPKVAYEVLWHLFSTLFQKQKVLFFLFTGFWFSLPTIWWAARPDYIYSVIIKMIDNDIVQPSRKSAHPHSRPIFSVSSIFSTPISLTSMEPIIFLISASASSAPPHFIAHEGGAPSATLVRYVLLYAICYML